MSRTIASARLIGRADELRRLDEALEAAAHGAATVVLVGGDAGIGKTRLLDEWTRRAQDAGAQVLTGACLPLGASALPYAPVVDALRQLVVATPVSRRAAVFGPASAYRMAATLIPELGDGHARHETVEVAPLDSRQARLFDQLVNLLERAASRAPLVLAIDDLHWADQSTLDLVTYIANSVDAGAVVVLAYRSDELTRRHPLRPVLAHMRREQQIASLDLRPLQRAELAELMTAICGDTPPVTMIDDIHTRSEGNPFFAEELLAAADMATTALPEALSDVLLSRVDRLGDDAQALVRVAAAVGRDVDHELLALVAERAGGLTDGRLLPALRTAVHEQVLVAGGDDVGYRFRHALLQEAVHADLLPGERVQLHAAIADMLAARPELAGRAGATATLAWHYAASHDHPRALTASLDAARAARDAAADADALQHLETALDLWDSVPDAAERAGAPLADVLLWAAAAAHHDRNPSRAASYARRSLAEIDAGADPTRAASAWMWLGRALHDAGLDGAFDAFRRAVELMPPDASAARARVLGAYANALMLMPRSREARTLAEEAVRVAREVGASVEEFHALVTLATVHSSLGDLDQSLVTFSAARALAQGHRGLDAGKVYVNHGEALFYAGRADDALAVCAEGLRWAEQHGASRSYGSWLRVNIAEYLITLGRVSEAEPHLAAARGLRGVDVGELHVWLQTARLDLARGRIDAVADRLRQADRVRHGMAAGAQFAEKRSEVRATFALAQGRPDEALQAVEDGLDAIECADGMRRYGGELYALGLRAAALLPPDARAGRDEILHARLVAARDDAPWGIGPVWAAQTAVADAEWATMQERDDAAERWLQAQQACADLGLTPGTIRARIRRAELLVPRDREQAAALFAQARQDATDAGLDVLRDEAEAAGNRANIRLGRRPTTPYGLTPRELDVLSLVARGMTNPQIGEALYISRKTASTHVSNILDKLGVRTRGEAAAVAHRHGIVEV